MKKSFFILIFSLTFSFSFAQLWEEQLGENASIDEKIRAFDQIFIMACKEDMVPLMKMMKIEHKKIESLMILGGGLVGRRVAQLLEKEVEIILIENDHDRAEDLASNLKNTQVIQGDGTDANILVMAGLDLSLIHI